MKTAIRYSIVTLFALQCVVAAADPNRSYRLESVDLKTPIIWGAQLQRSDRKGLAFGGQHQDAKDGRPHTRILVDGQWKPIHAELRSKNPLQTHVATLSALRTQVKNTAAQVRTTYFQGSTRDQQRAVFATTQVPAVARIVVALDQELRMLSKRVDDEYVVEQSAFVRRQILLARELLKSLDWADVPGVVRLLWQAQTRIERASESCDAQPPPRAMNCGRARRIGDKYGAESQTIAYDAKTKLYVVFGGDHLDYLTNDIWVFDEAKRRWFQRHPKGAPAPRANHRLVFKSEGVVSLVGGYTYSNSTDYLGGQYVGLVDATWDYDVEENRWSSASGNAAKLKPADSRIYRKGPFHPAFFLQGERPDAAKFSAWLAKLPVNEWVATNPLYRPRLNRDWGTARLDSDHDVVLRWSGGHSAHGGTDVPHFHLSTNRWELPFPVEFPLGQLYSNTSYPNGLNFNHRPWMTGHTYQNYAYDSVSQLMVKAGRPRHFYLYDPVVGDWIARGEKPKAMQYNSCFYTLTLCSTPRGVVCWGKYGKVHLFDSKARRWSQLELTGEELPGAYVDNSTICYDSIRNRVLIFNTPGYGKPFDGEVYAISMRTNVVTRLSPLSMEHANRFQNVDKCCYDPVNQLVLFGTYLKDVSEHSATPAYDCERNRWVTLDLKYRLEKRGQRTIRAFPHRRSDAIMYDARRKLIWGTDTNSQVYVLRLEAKPTVLTTARP